MHKLETTTGSFLDLTSGSLSGKAEVNSLELVCPTEVYIQLEPVY